MIATRKICLLDDWRKIARRAWSVRLSIVAAIFTAAEVVVPLFGDVLPRGVLGDALRNEGWRDGTLHEDVALPVGFRFAHHPLY